jgi:hypothetical protein
MKARKRDSNDEWKDVIYVQLEGSDILYKERYLEFQHDNISTELKTNDQVNTKKHWQDVRERAAIAALNGLLSDVNHHGNSIDFVRRAINCANELVKQLKGE